MRQFPVTILVLALALLTRNAGATEYYIDSNGDDLRDGKSAGTAWKTLAKANATSLQAGDAVLLNRGARFHETIMPSKSGVAGKPIKYGAYGIGAKPVLSGFSTIPVWTSAGTNMWTAPIPNGSASVMSLVIGNVLQPLGRFPKPSASNGGYLTVASHTGDTSIMDPALASAPDFTGGEIYLRMDHWIAYRGPISAHVGSALTFPSTKYSLTDGYGYFVQNHPSTLKTNGDWYYDATKKMVGLYFTGTPPAVSVPTLDQLVSMKGNSYIEFNDLAFEGSNGAAIYGISSSFTTIRNCSFDFAGTHAINLRFGSNIIIDKNTFTRSVSESIAIYNGNTFDDVTITNNTIDGTGMVTGMAAPQSQKQAISVTVGSRAIVDHNIITNTGYDAINFEGNDIAVTHNVIDGFCSVNDDGGAIYTSNPRMNLLSNRKVAFNIISRGIGAPAGTRNGASYANGIYLDNNSNHVEVTDNTVSDVTLHAFHGNSNQYVTMKRNNFFDNGIAWGQSRWVNDGSVAAGGQDVIGMVVEDNVFFNKTADQTSFSYIDRGINFPTPSTLNAHLISMGTVNNNFYHAPNATPFTYYARDDKNADYVFPPNQSLAQWQVASSLERASILVPAYPPYIVNGLVGANLYPNGDLEAGISGISGSGAPILAWDKTSKLDGAGALSISLTADPSRPNASEPIKAAFGPVSAAKKYLVRVSTLGETERGLLRLTLRQSSGATILAPAQYRPFGTKRVDHEFLVDAPTSDSAASWQFDIFKSSGTTYVDTIIVSEVNAAVSNPNDYVRFEVNKTDVASSVALATTYADARGLVYCGTLTLAPFSSVILMKSTRECTPAPVDAGAERDGGERDAGVQTGTNDAASTGGCSCTTGPRPMHGTAARFGLPGLCVFALFTARLRRRSRRG